MSPSPLFDYQLENFDPSPDEELICSICRCVFFDPVECPCRHVFCQKCILQWLNHHRNCPVCRKRISKSTLQDVVPIIKNMIMKLTLLCRNAEKGCTAKCSVELYESHLKTCDFEMIQCANGSCGAVIMRMNKGRHEDTECHFRSVTCKVCKVNVMLYAQQNHDCVRELLSIIQKKDEKIAELLQETDTLKQELEKHKAEREEEKTSIRISSDSGDISSVTSLSLSMPSSTYEDSDLDDYNLPIFSVLHPTESFSVPENDANESQNIDPSVQEISRIEDFLPMDSTNNYSGDSPKSSSSDYVEESDQFSPIVSSNSRETTEHEFNSNRLSRLSNAANYLQSRGRSLKRRMQELIENNASFEQNTRFNPVGSFLSGWDSHRFRMAHSDPETPMTFTAFVDASSKESRAKYRKQGGQSVGGVNDTIDILDSPAEDANEPSSSYLPSSGSNISSFRELYRPNQNGVKGLRGKTQRRSNDNYAASVPRSRVPLPVAHPGSSSTPVFSDHRMSYHSVRNRGGGSEASDERSSSHGLKNTLSLLAKYADKESDPDWLPSSDCHEESDGEASGATTSSSKERFPVLAENPSFFSPTCEQGRDGDISDSSSSSSSSSSPTDFLETDSSYEVEIPPTAWDLIQRYCEVEDSEDDSEWYPASAI